MDTKWQTQLREPANAKKLIQILHRYITPTDDELKRGGFDPSAKKMKVIWNGQVGDKSCLVDYDTRNSWDNGDTKHCPDIDDILQKTPCGTGPNARKRDRNARNWLVARDDDSCPIGGSGGEGGGKTMTVTDGPKPSPTCEAADHCGGHVCTGYFCNPNPTGHPPGYYDPKDPNHDDGGSGDKLCQVDSGCADFQCPSGQTGRCRQGHCKCEDGETPGGQECLHSQDCTSFHCDDGKQPYCDGSRCACKDVPPSNKQVRIFFYDAESNDPLGGGGNAFAWYWVWFQANTGTALEICKDDPAYKTETDTNPNNDAAKWPPSLSADKDVWGHSNCKYTANGDKPGSFECDGVARVDCQDYHGSNTANCGDGVIVNDTYYPKVICTLPGGA